MPEFAPSRQPLPIEMTCGAAAGEGAHDRGAAADVAVGPDDDAGADPALDHRRAQRAGVEVDEALVHDRRPLGQVGAQPHPVAVGDADAGGDDVVDHPRELVDAEDGHVADRRPQPVGVEARRPRPGPALVQATLVSSPKMPVRFAPCGRISRCESRCSRSQTSWVSTGGADRSGMTVRTAMTSHAARLVPADQAAVVGAELAGELQCAEPGRAGPGALGRAEPGLGVPGVEHRPRGGDGRETGGDGRDGRRRQSRCGRYRRRDRAWTAGHRAAP